MLMKVSLYRNSSKILDLIRTTGKPITSNTPAAIFYDPDSADDIDDDDPDEDLDI